MKSTGWRTEALQIAAALLVLAIVGDLADRFDLGRTAELVASLGALGLQALAVVTARAREVAKKRAQQALVFQDGAAGA